MAASSLDVRERRTRLVGIGFIVASALAFGAMAILARVAYADGRQAVHGIFAAVPYCLDLIGGPYIETNDAVCKAFRPKNAIRPKD